MTVVNMRNRLGLSTVHSRKGIIAITVSRTRVNMGAKETLFSQIGCEEGDN